MRTIPFAVTAFASALGISILAGDAASSRLAPIYPTPETIVTRMLQLGQLRAGERMCDLGSGDGRIVIAAARAFHANATGVEIDDKLYRESHARIHQLGLDQTARVIHGDLRKHRYSSYDLVTVFLNSDSNDLIQPMLERDLKKGARVVSHNFAFRNWRPTLMETIDGEPGAPKHTLYLYER